MGLPTVSGEAALVFSVNRGGGSSMFYKASALLAPGGEFALVLFRLAEQVGWRGWIGWMRRCTMMQGSDRD